MEKQILELYQLIIWVFATIKAWIIGHLTLELYRSYQTKSFSLKRYFVSFIITLWLLYFAHTLLNYFEVYEVNVRDLIMGFVWAFSLKIVEKLEQTIPEILDGFKEIFKNWVLNKSEKLKGRNK